MWNVRTGLIQPLFNSKNETTDNTGEAGRLKRASVEAEQNTISPDIMERAEGRAEAAEAGGLWCPAQAEHILHCPLLLVYCPSIVHQSVSPLCPARSARAIVRTGDGSRALSTGQGQPDLHTTNNNTESAMAGLVGGVWLTVI